MAMFFGGFGEGFPYVNFHDLNLDWIIKAVREEKTNIETFRTQLEAMGVDIEEFRAYIENIDSEIHTHVVEEVEEQVPIAIHEEIESGGFNEVLTESRKRRYVFIGDSYAEGYTPQGNITGFPLIIKSEMNIQNADFYNIYYGGARFGASAENEYAFDTILGNALPNIEDKETITDIIFACGYNDANANYSDINTGINRCKTLISSNFTNPSLRIYIFAIGYNASSMSARKAMYDRYMYCYSKAGWSFYHLTPAICYEQWWSTDGYHPLADAQSTIAKCIESALRGGTEITPPVIDEYATTDKGASVFYILPKKDYFDCFLHGGNLSENSISLSNNISNAVEIMEITSKFPIANDADSTKLKKYTVPAIIKMEGNTYEDVNLIIYLEQKTRNTYAVKANILQLNSSKNGYLSLSNITEIQILQNSMHFTIPYQF